MDAGSHRAMFHGLESALDSMLTPALVGLGSTYMQLGALYYSAEAGLPRGSFQARGGAALRRDSLSADALIALGRP